MTPYALGDLVGLGAGDKAGGFYVDAMEVLAELAVVRCGKQLRTI